MLSASSLSVPEASSPLVSPALHREGPVKHPQQGPAATAAVEDGGGGGGRSAAAAPAAVEVTVGHRVGSAVMGSVVTAFLLTPLDVARVRTQVAHSGVTLDTCKMYNGLMEVFSTECVQAHRSCACQTANLLAQNRGVGRALRILATREGLPALWRGLGPSLALSLPTTVFYYSAYDSLRPVLAQTLPGGLATC
eukprot:RCo000717